MTKSLSYFVWLAAVRFAVRPLLDFTTQWSSSTDARCEAQYWRDDDHGVKRLPESKGNGMPPTKDYKFGRSSSKQRKKTRRLEAYCSVRNLCQTLGGLALGTVILLKSS